MKNLWSFIGHLLVDTGNTNTQKKQNEDVNQEVDKQLQEFKNEIRKELLDRREKDLETKYVEFEKNIGKREKRKERWFNIVGFILTALPDRSKSTQIQMGNVRYKDS